MIATLAWWFIFQPAASESADEYKKWLIVRLLHFGLPWFLDLLVVLAIAFSLERTRGGRRLWILAGWTIVTAALVWSVVFRSASAEPAYGYTTYWKWVTAGLLDFSFPCLFSLLVALWVALWLNSRLAEHRRPLEGAGLSDMR
jgi:hypothetical protein